MACLSVIYNTSGRFGYGVEPIERSWRLHTKLPLQVVVQPRQAALQEAKENREGMIFWTDGSRLDSGRSGSAVVWLDTNSNKWQEKQRYLGEKKDSFDAELWAISDALEMTIKKTRNTNPTTVTIFTDSHAANTKILEPKIRPGGGLIRDLIHRNALDIQNDRRGGSTWWLKNKRKV